MRFFRTAYRWNAAEPPIVLLLGALLTIFGLFDLGVVIHNALVMHTLTPDFLGLWSFGRFALHHDPSLLYDATSLGPFQTELAHRPMPHFAYVYPPTYLLILQPLSHLPYLAAYVAWIACTAVTYCLATRMAGQGIGWSVASLAAPTAMITIIYGQSGFLTSALLVGGLRLLPSRPVLAGVLFGLLTYKPQLGVLVPVVLLAAGAWRSIAAAVLTTLALIGVSSLCFGWSMWTRWIDSMRLAAGLMASSRASLFHDMPTVTAGLRMLGAAPAVAYGVQAMVALIVVILTYACVRRAAKMVQGRELTTALVAVGTFLATPYAFVYDMPMVTSAILLLVVQRRKDAGSFNLGEILLILATLVCPIIMHAQSGRAPIAPVILLLLFASIAWRILRPVAPATIRDETHRPTGDGLAISAG